MRRLLWVAATLAALGLAPAADAQQRKPEKVKDIGLMEHLDEQISLLNAQLKQLADHITALEAEIAKIKQAQAEAANDLRNTQNLMKATDTSVSNLRLASESGVLGLKSDLATLRQELTTLSELLRRNFSGGQMPAQAPAPAQPQPVPQSAASQQPAPEPPAIEGYITQVSEDLKEVKINLGSDKVKEGTQLYVFRSSDPKTQIGIIEVKQVLDNVNSMCSVIYVRKPNTLEFSDIVRLRP